MKAGERGEADYILGELRCAAADLTTATGGDAAAALLLWKTAKQAFFNAMNKNYVHPSDEHALMKRVMMTYSHLGGNVAMVLDVAMLHVQQAVSAPRDTKPGKRRL